MALTLVGTSPWPVTKTIGHAVAGARQAPSCSSSPVSPGIRTSSTRQHGPAYGSRAGTRGPRRTPRPCSPADASNRVEALPHARRRRPRRRPAARSPSWRRSRVDRQRERGRSRRHRALFAAAHPARRARSTIVRAIARPIPSPSRLGRVERLRRSARGRSSSDAGAPSPGRTPDGAAASRAVRMTRVRSPPRWGSRIASRPLSTRFSTTCWSWTRSPRTVRQVRRRGRDSIDTLRMSGIASHRATPPRATISLRSRRTNSEVPLPEQRRAAARITSAARLSSATMSSTISRISSRFDDVDRRGRRWAACALLRIAVSGWFSSWASDAVELAHGRDAADVRELLPEPLRLELPLLARQRIGEDFAEEVQLLDQLVRTPRARRRPCRIPARPPRCHPPAAAPRPGA